MWVSWQSLGRALGVSAGVRHELATRLALSRITPLQVATTTVRTADLQENRGQAWRF